ncbi:hypothetical protein Poly24_51500 [Rosistilla carotiformis]|uniref:Lipoprotein n=1 Tax=Rosistilla carotiformis TaxID=2528017 RepID=A0A518K0T8_9BACT|nr:hypothetical protein [Rosistilla carotiformis]QDV71414.1 hypothetical protein Poly24_51500 [Rosistilla carotiformis]
MSPRFLEFKLHATLSLLPVLFTSLLVGCGGETDLLAEAKEKAAAAVTDIADAAKEVAHQTATDITGAKPTATVTIGQVYEELECRVLFHPLSDGRGGILQVMNYQDEEGAEGKVAYLIHAPVSETSFDELAGRQISGRFFFQSGDQVWYSPDDHPVQLTVQKGVLQQTISLEGTLTLANENTTLAASGTFTGPLE